MYGASESAMKTARDIGRRRRARSPRVDAAVRRPRRLPVVVAAVAAAALVMPAAASAATKCEQITEEFSSPISQAGRDFRVKDLSVLYVSGTVKVARSCTDSSKPSVDDGLLVEVTRPSGEKTSFSHDFSAGCSGTITPAEPFDITDRFVRGRNAVKVRLRDLCGQGGSSSSPLYLIFEEVIQRYRVELKAWIPKTQIVDPNIPLPAPYLSLGVPPLAFALALPRAPCFATLNPALAASLFVRSGFLGDTHEAYDGSFRIRPVAEFDWDGEQIRNFSVTPPAESFGTTILEYELASRLPFVRDRACTRSLQQVAAAGGQQLSPTRFELTMSADDPLVYPRAVGPDALLVPNIDARLEGSFLADGRLAVAYDTDLFPSHGLRVAVDGTDRETLITNDVSCLDDSSAQGLFGVGLLGTALSLHDNRGSLVVDPAQAPRNTREPGQICAAEFLTVDFAGYARSLLGIARAASAVSTLRIAPLDAAGKPGAFVTLDAAVKQGLVTKTEITGSHFVLGVNPAKPVMLRSQGTASLTTTRLKGGKPGAASQFGPVDGKLEATLTAREVTVKRNGRRLAPARRDTQPPRTTTKARVRGKVATVTVDARDRSGVQTTIAVLRGKRLTIRGKRVRVATKQLAQLRIWSIDVFGNSERPRRVRVR
jgi:hypothetical protein